MSVDAPVGVDTATEIAILEELEATAIKAAKAVNALMAGTSTIDSQAKITFRRDGGVDIDVSGVKAFEPKYTSTLKQEVTAAIKVAVKDSETRPGKEVTYKLGVGDRPKPDIELENNLKRYIDDFLGASIIKNSPLDLRNLFPEILAPPTAESGRETPPQFDLSERFQLSSFGNPFRIHNTNIIKEPDDPQSDIKLKLILATSSAFASTRDSLADLKSESEILTAMLRHNLGEEFLERINDIANILKTEIEAGDRTKKLHLTLNESPDTPGTLVAKPIATGKLVRALGTLMQDIPVSEDGLRVVSSVKKFAIELQLDGVTPTAEASISMHGKYVDRDEEPVRVKLF